jgi:hypothetical protein
MLAIAALAAVGAAIAGFIAGICVHTEAANPVGGAASSRADVGSVFISVENPTGAYSYDALDEQHLCDFTCDQLIGPLTRALEHITNNHDSPMNRWDAFYASALSLALIDHCQARGVGVLLHVYSRSRGNEVKGLIADALVDRRRDESLSTILEGLQHEGNPDVLVSVDWALSNMTLHDRFYDPDHPERSVGVGWKAYYDYWRQQLAGDSRLSQSCLADGSASEARDAQ